MIGKARLLGDPFSTELQLEVSNLALSPLSPYAGRYLGYAIGKGKLTLGSSVRIEGTGLQSEHSVLLDQLSLGERVQSQEAIDAPVKLGIALLKDRSGEIHIDKSVSGDLSDPEFSVADLVMRVLVNALIKAGTSPFTMLGAVFGGGEDINIARFTPGESSLDQEAKKKLGALGKALFERPVLSVDVLGRADTSRDRKALESMRLRSKLREVKYERLGGEDRPSTAMDALRIAPEEYGPILLEAYKAAPMGKPRNALGLIKKLSPAAMEQRLRDFLAVTEADLRQLASDRAQAVLGFLNRSGPVASERLFLLGPELGTAEDEAYIKAEVRMH